MYKIATPLAFTRRTRSNSRSIACDSSDAVGSSRIRKRAPMASARAISTICFDLDVNQLAADLSVEQKQIVEIARALAIGARFLILDEPTASLESHAIERLFERVRRVKDSGVGILYISHH